MSKQTEALKLALEYLRDNQHYIADNERHAYVMEYNAFVERLEALAHAPTVREQPAQDNTYNYAKSLAEAIFKQHFASDEHYASGRIVWGVNDTVIGILTQIDNMVADMVRRPAQQQEPVAIDRLYIEALIEGLYQNEDPVSIDAAEEFERLLKTPASPPASKPWVELTELEALGAYEAEQQGRWGDHVRGLLAVEAKLREKNT